MDIIRVKGGKPLIGKIHIGGAKNAALPIMASTLLTADTMLLSNIPNLADVITMNQLLMNHGSELSICGSSVSQNKTGRTILLKSENIKNFNAPYEIVKKMRASILVLGPLLARFGYARVSLPGGCAIGNRPINLHLYAFEQLGAKITLVNGYIEARADNGLKGANIHFDVISVGATENALMAATLAEGETIITNAACEPEISNLANCLVAMGAKITGIGTSTLKINGVAKLHGAHHRVIADRIEAGSYVVAAAVTDGQIELCDLDYDLVLNISDRFEQAGISIINNGNSILVSRKERNIVPVDITTQAYPGFPTDMQAQFMMMMSIANGTSIIRENVFENRFMHVPELNRMGANITINGSAATIKGVRKLEAASVMASDLRASISLIFAGLVANGESYINRVYHLDRGYEAVEQKLFACGADINRINSN